MSPVILMVTKNLRYYDTLNVLPDPTLKSNLESYISVIVWTNTTVDTRT